ncbi:acetyltransferase, partial [Clostridioides difficile]|nr:acetyltransferase [Clostridioides difficile]
AYRQTPAPRELCAGLPVLAAVLRCAVDIRTVDVDAHADLFSGWMNLDRVAHFWDQRGTRDEHAAYLAERRADPHMHPMIGYFDDTPFGYFEFYWAKEDRLAPFYDAHDYDRGLHLLIGD